jgi:hypothetical protein
MRAAMDPDRCELREPLLAALEQDVDPSVRAQAADTLQH